MKATSPSSAEIKRKLKALAQNLKIPFDQVELLLAIEVLVKRLNQSRILSSTLVYKGGFVGFKVYHTERYTVDLDASVIKIPISTLEAEIEAITGEREDGFWFGELQKSRLPHQTEHGGVRFTLRYSIGAPRKKRCPKIDLDLGIGDIITPHPIEIESKSLLGDADLCWKVYPRETIVAEKLESLVRHKELPSRAKDLYDLTILIPECNTANLKQAIEATFSHCRTIIPKSFAEILSTADKTHLRNAIKKVRISSGRPLDIEIILSKLKNLLSQAVDPLFNDKL